MFAYLDPILFHFFIYCINLENYQVKTRFAVPEWWVEESNNPKLQRLMLAKNYNTDHETQLFFFKNESRIVIAMGEFEFIGKEVKAFHLRK